MEGKGERGGGGREETNRQLNISTNQLMDQCMQARKEYFDNQYEER